MTHNFVLLLIIGCKCKTFIRTTQTFWKKMFFFPFKTIVFVPDIT